MPHALVMMMPNCPLRLAAMLQRLTVSLDLLSDIRIIPILEYTSPLPARGQVMGRRLNRGGIWAHRPQLQMPLEGQGGAMLRRSLSLAEYRSG